jgi:ABC-type sugar transport system ATPase subunit
MAKLELVNLNRTLTQTQFKVAWNIMSFLFPKRSTVSAQGETTRSADTPFSLKDINLTVLDGKTMVVLGPSGCGKTTLLKIIAGLEHLDSGEVRYDGVNKTDIRPGDRKIGMVFQSFALFPHFTSKKNILSHYFFRNQIMELDENAREKFERTSELLGVEIAHLLDRMPHNLSGGEKQRVALGRCITRDPVLFLLDEPFSNLDQKLREKFRINLKKLLNHFKITTIYVTHDQREASILADLITIMDDGRIVQIGTYERIYKYPKNIFVAELLNLDTDTPAINLIKSENLDSEFEGQIVGVRPEDVEVFKDHREGCLASIILNIINLPVREMSILNLKLNGDELYVHVPQSMNLATGDQVYLNFKYAHVFNRDTGTRMRSYSEN